MGHVKVRNRVTGGVWECPEDLVDQVLDAKDPFFGPSWIKAAADAEPTNEAPADPASGTSKEKKSNG